MLTNFILVGLFLTFVNCDKSIEHTSEIENLEILLKHTTPYEEPLQFITLEVLKKRQDAAMKKDFHIMYAKQYANKYSIDPDLILSIMEIESSCRWYVVSPVGAMGLMQLMPGTANEMGVSNPFDIKQNIMGGTKYFSRMMSMFDNDTTLALAAYNSGPGIVIRYGVISQCEVYVDKVMRAFHKRKCKDKNRNIEDHHEKG